MRTIDLSHSVVPLATSSSTTAAPCLTDTPRARRTHRLASGRHSRGYISTARAAPRVRRAEGLEQRLPLVCTLAALHPNAHTTRVGGPGLANELRPRRLAREDACGPSVSSAATDLVEHGTRPALLREGAGAHPRGHVGERGRAAGRGACRHGRAGRAIRAGLASGGPRGRGARRRAAVPESRARYVGRRRRHDRHPRPAHARSRRGGAACA